MSSQIAKTLGRLLPSATCLALLTGCHGDQNMLAPAGPGARSVAFLGTVSFVVFGAATVVTWALLAFAALRRKGSLAEHESPDVGGGQRWIFIGGFLIPAVTLGALFVLTLARLDEFPLHDGSEHAPEVRLVGHQWWWEIHYLGRRPELSFTTANELHVPAGQRVELELESSDVIHSFWVPRLHGKVDLVPGQKNHLRLFADRPGVYEGQCAEYCGTEHANMRLLVVAQSPADFAAWVENSMKPAVSPADEVAAAGQHLFESGACALCHRVRGTLALGTVGPDLTHVASRRRLAANTLPNNHAYISAWAERAQALKPAVLMPNITQFNGVELDELTRYLQTLK